MDAASRTRLWGWNTALDSGFVRGALVSLGIILIAAPFAHLVIERGWKK
jgi:hypothetical protein